MTDKLTFEVVVHNPQVGSKDMADYIREAIQSWKGSLHPDNPLFDQQSRDFTVKPQRCRLGVSTSDYGGLTVELEEPTAGNHCVAHPCGHEFGGTVMYVRHLDRELHVCRFCGCVYVEEPCQATPKETPPSTT